MDSFLATGTSSANQNVDNFLVPALPDQKRDIYGQPINPQTPSQPRPSHPKQSWLCGSSQLDMFCFSFPCSLFFIR